MIGIKVVGDLKITNELNRLGIKSKNKSVWQMTSVQRIVRSPIYKGTFILNQYTSVKVVVRKTNSKSKRKVVCVS